MALKICASCPNDICYCVYSFVSSPERGSNVYFDTRADYEFFRLDVEITDQCEREETLLPMLICVIM